MATLIFLQPSCDPYDFDPSAVGKEEKTRFALMDVTETALLDMSPSVNKEKKRTVYPNTSSFLCCVATRNRKVY